MFIKLYCQINFGYPLVIKLSKVMIRTVIIFALEVFSIIGSHSRSVSAFGVGFIFELAMYRFVLRSRGR